MLPQVRLKSKPKRKYNFIFIIFIIFIFVIILRILYGIYNVTNFNYNKRISKISIKQLPCCQQIHKRCEWWNNSPYIIPICEKENLLNLLKFFKNLNVPFFLIYGTLLGAIREGDHISHETDIDIAIEKSLWNKILKNKIINSIKNTGYILNITSNPIRLFYSNINKIHVDIWFYDKLLTTTNFYIYNKLHVYNNKLLFPLINCKYNDNIYKCPQQSKKLLKIFYGKSWNIPLNYMKQKSIQKQKLIQKKIKNNSIT